MGTSYYFIAEKSMLKGIHIGCLLLCIFRKEGNALRFIKEITLFTPSGTLKRFQGLETSFKVEQGKISALISESELTELRNGDKTMYSRLYSAEQTVSGLEKLYTDVTGKYDAVSKQYTSLDTKVGEYKSAVDGFSGDLQQLSTTINDNYSTTKSMQTYVKAQVDGLSTVVSETYVKTDTLSEYSTTEQTKSMIDQKTDQIKLDVREKIYGTNYCKNGTFETFTGWVAYLDKKPCITYLGKTCAYLVSGNSIWMNYDYTVDADESNTIIFEAASPEKVALNIKIDDTTIKTFYSSEMSKEWKEFSVDVKLKKGKHTIQFVTSSNASVLYVTNVQIKQDIIESTHSQINIIQSSIESKVSKNGIISSINQSSEKVSISAGKINFNGLVTANNYFQILTGGSFVAAYGTLGGWTVKDGIMKSNDQKIVLDPVNNKIYFDDGDDDFVTELSPDGTRTNFLTVDGGIVGGDAALLISAASSSRIQFYDSFSDDGEDEIVVLLRQIEKLLAALPQAHAPQPAGADGDEALAQLVTGSLGIQPGVVPHLDAGGVVADHAQGQEDQPADGPHRADHAGPADDGGSRGPADDGVDQHEDADGKDEEAQAGNVADGLDGQGGDALHGKTEHFLERIFGFAREALRAVVIDLFGRKAQERHHAAQKQIDLAKTQQRFQRAVREQAVVRMVVHNFRAEQAHQLIETFSGQTLEGRVRFAALAHAIDHITALAVGVQKAMNGFRIVLQIGVDGNHRVALIAGQRHACPQRVLVPGVVRELRALKTGILKALDDVPGGVLAAVVHKKHTAFGRDFAKGNQGIHQFGKPARGFGQHFFLIVTGNDDIKRGCRIHNASKFWLPKQAL